MLNWDTNKIEELNKEKIEEEINRMAEGALRTICIAYREVGENDESKVKEENERGIRRIEEENLILVGICGIRDIPREGV